MVADDLGQGGRIGRCRVSVTRIGLVNCKAYDIALPTRRRLTLEADHGEERCSRRCPEKCRYARGC